MNYHKNDNYFQDPSEINPILVLLCEYGRILISTHKMEQSIHSNKGLRHQTRI